MSVDAEPDGTASDDTSVAALQESLAGDVDVSESARTLYSTDASIYQVQPAGVAFPETKADVREIVTFAREHEVSVTARGAGSSLTGNAIGEGLVVDCSRYLDEIASIDPDARTATVQPGVVLDELNAELEAHGLYFPPDPSTSSTCTIGGMVANDAAGPHSVLHGTTRDNVRAVECVLADGSVARFERVSGRGLERVTSQDGRVGSCYETLLDLRDEYGEEIESRYPDLERNSSGYDLKSSVAQDGRWADLSNLIVGSEGTLAFITEVTLELTERPETRAAALVFYDDVITAADAVTEALEADPSAVELIDDTVLGFARDAWDLDLVPEEAGAALLLEVETTHEAQEVAVKRAVAAATTDATIGSERATSDEAQADLWQVRKASNPLLNRRPGDEQALSFIEDASIPPENLPAYLRGVREILVEHDLDASVFGHAGQGVLHIKPFLNLKTEADRERLEAVSEQVHELVIDVGGCVSGEHGDGRLRSQYIEQMYGEELYAAFLEVKETFDPEGVFNPGNVVPAGDSPVPTPADDLRYEGYDPETVETALDFGDEEGFDSLVEQCNGCSKCRTTLDGVMCPSYRGVEDEITSTRGRANMLRAAIDGELGDEALTSDWFQEEVLDLCLSCKACETECPTGVDMAKLKTEAKHQKHQQTGVPLRARLFGNVRLLNRMGSMLAPVANRLKSVGPLRTLAEKTVGIDQRRTLPDFATESFVQWFEDHEPAPTAGAHGTVALFPDCYMAYNHPEVGKAAVHLLEGLGYQVEVPSVNCCGRPALSQGLVDQAREDASANVDALADYARRDVPIISVEPSCVSALEEYDDLVDQPGSVPEVAATVAEFVNQRVLAGEVSLDGTAVATRVAVHGHCHSTARGRDHHPVALLRQAGYEVEVVETSCCGMAGAFGYETEHYDLSMALGDDLAAKLDAADPDVIATTGASCRQQLHDREIETKHPLQLLAEVVA